MDFFKMVPKVRQEGVSYRLHATLMQPYIKHILGSHNCNERPAVGKGSQTHKQARLGQVYQSILGTKLG